MSIAHLGVDVAILKVATLIEMERQQQLLNPIQRADTSSSSQAPKRSTGRGGAGQSHRKWKKRQTGTSSGRAPQSATQTQQIRAESA